MCWHQVSPSPFPSSSSSFPHTTNYTTKQLHIQSPSLHILSVHKYRYASPHVTWFAQEVHESKIDHINAIYPSGSTEIQVHFYKRSRSVLSCKFRWEKCINYFQIFFVFCNINTNMLSVFIMFNVLDIKF